MTDHDALLAAVCAHRDDDTPRLVMADWYQENGQPERAAFVRRQVELARNDGGRSYAKLAVSRFGVTSFAALAATEPWKGLRPDHVHPMWVVVGKRNSGYARCVCWHRGFPTVVGCTERNWHLTPSLWAYPVEALCLTGQRGGLWGAWLDGETGRWHYRSLASRRVPEVCERRNFSPTQLAFPNVRGVYSTCTSYLLNEVCAGKLLAAW